MNFFEFVVDESVEGIFLHHFNGLLLNRIPLMKRLKLRSIAGFNFVWVDSITRKTISAQKTTLKVCCPLNMKASHLRNSS